MKARKAAFLASLTWEKKPVDRKLAQWIAKESPTGHEIALAKEIAFGTIKRWISLEYLLQDALPKRYREAEKLLFLQAGYQYLFMDGIPFYALVSETVDIAKEKFGKSKGKLFNALLRKLPERVGSLEVVQENLSLVYSYPEFFVNKMLFHYGTEKTKELLETMNRFYPPTFRVREEVDFPIEILYKNYLTAARSSEKKRWNALLTNKKIYIQNVTFIYLMDQLFSHLKQQPKKILDLCAAPGGKTLILSDLYPEASILANDVTEEKQSLLEENREKYKASFSITSHLAEKYPTDRKYDLILLDAPCSGSGVLGKRAEARYRLTPKKIQEQVALQKKMVERTLSLMNEGGSLWYMTCSILPEENEEIVAYAKKIGFKEEISFLQLPNQEGWDGGYASWLSK